METDTSSRNALLLAIAILAVIVVAGVIFFTSNTTPAVPNTGTETVITNPVTPALNDDGTIDQGPGDR